MRFFLVLVTSVLFAGLVPLLLDAGPASANVPSGFEDRVIADLERPTALAFTPDGRMLIATQPGRLRMYKDGTLLKRPVLDLSNKICSNSERGLLGVTLDPNFSSNRYVYLYYTFNKYGVCPGAEPSREDNPVNRVSRFKISGSTIDPGSEKVLLTNIPSPNGNHNGGDLHFGKDGKLYVSVGDGSCDYAEPNQCQANNDASRDRNILLGKILRINPDGTIPSGNPYAQTGDRCGNVGNDGRTAPGNDCKETYARGFRNPFRMAFDPDASGTVFNVNDVGGDSWEEVDRLKMGADYGWNVCEGRHDNPLRPGSVDCSTSFEPPIHEYGHGTGCSSITGAAFVPDGSFRPADDDAYLFGDYVCGKIFELKRNTSGGYDATTFASNLGQGGPIAMTFGKVGGFRDLYYTTYAGNSGGQVHRIAYVGGNRAPSATAQTAGPNFGPQDEQFRFSGEKSTDPNPNDKLSYSWTFGDGTSATGQTVAHTYDTPGRKKVTLTVDDGRSGKSETTLAVYPGDTAMPVPVIESPLPDDLFAVGENVTLTGSATDADDGSVSGDHLTWEVLRHHNGNHTHPYFEGTGGNLTFSAPAPEELRATDPTGNYLEVRLIATDSQGLASKVLSRKLEPNTVGITFETQPADLKLSANGEVFRTSHELLSWEGYNLNVGAPSQWDGAGHYMIFRSWSDGGSKTHTITTPDSSVTRTATFERR